MLMRHNANVLIDTAHRVTNATAEGLSKIMATAAVCNYTHTKPGWTIPDIPDEPSPEEAILASF